MGRQEIYTEIEKTLGLVPTMFKQLPEDTLEWEWRIFKRQELGEGAIPNKYRELIGIGVAAATHCQYCTLFHTEVARLLGATDREIEEAVNYAKHTTGWSTYVNGLQLPYEEFRDEVRRVMEHLKAQGAGTKAA